MAKIYADLIRKGIKTLDQVPAILQTSVAELLLDSGVAELVPAEFGGTAQSPTE